MQAGKLNKRATIKRLIETDDAMGGVTESWTALGAPISCGFIALRGGERATALGQQSTMVGTLFFRYSPLSKAIKLGDLIEVDGQAFIAMSNGINESMLNQSITVAVEAQ